MTTTAPPPPPSPLGGTAPTPSRGGFRIAFTLAVLIGGTLLGAAFLLVNLASGSWHFAHDGDWTSEPTADGQLTFQIAADKNGAPSCAARPGGALCSVPVAVSNTGDEARTFDPGVQTMIGSDGVVYPAAAAHAVVLRPGDPRRGFVLEFAVPAGVHPDRVYLRDAGSGDGAWLGLPSFLFEPRR